MGVTLSDRFSGDSLVDHVIWLSRFTSRASFETYGVSSRPFRWIESCGDTLHWGIFPSSIFHLAFRATISSQFGVHSHQHFPFGVQSHYFFSVLAFRAINIFHLAFRAIISSQIGVQSHQHFPFGIQSHYLFSVSEFRAISMFHLAFRATISSQSRRSEPSAFSIWRSEPLFLLSLGIQSHQHFSLGIQSHYFFSVSAFRAISMFHLAFRATISSQSRRSEPSTFSIWCLEPLFLLSLDIQSYQHFSFSV